MSVDDLREEAPRPPGRPPAPCSVSRRMDGKRLLIGALVLMIALAPIEFSYGRALGAPGSDSFSVRTVEWLRDHGCGPAVNVVENWVYAWNRPTGPMPEPASVPRSPRAVATAPGLRPANLPARVAPALDGEGVWVPVSRSSSAPAAVFTSWFRPDPELPSVLAGVAWMNQSLIRTSLIAGLNEPVPYDASLPAADDAGGQVPPSSTSALLATFNSGFKMKDANGGYYTAGREVRPLRIGAASLSIDRDGRVSIGSWGRDLALTPATVAVRQNLDLVVEAGRPVPGLETNPTGAWGSPRNQLQYTWRSGIGLDPGGNLVYVAADHITLSDLARAMAAAGVVTGMQLDIHGNTVSYLVYRSRHAASQGSGSRLLPLMKTRKDRYTTPDRRDFFAVTERPARGAS